MEFFDKLGKKASEAYKITADKTGRMAKETKLKIKMNDLKSEVNDLYAEIGKKVYEKHVTEEEISIKRDLESECTKIDVLSDEIEQLLLECLDLKDKKQCPNCYKQIEKQNNYCPNCGQKQNESQAKEVEVLEKLQNTNVSEDNKNEKRIVEEELKNNIDKSNNQNEKENNDETNDKRDNNEEQYEEDESMSNLEKTVSIESDIDIEELKEEDE